MMNVLRMSFVIVLATTSAGWSDEPEKMPAVERGRIATRTVTSPLATFESAYAQLWRRWGMDEKPEHFNDKVAARYGLHKAPHDNNSMPMGLHAVKGPLGTTGIKNDCLVCHAGRIAGQTIIGLGNSSLDFQSLHEDLAAGDPLPMKIPFKLSNGRGIIEATASTIFLLQFRDADLNLTVPHKLTLRDDLCEDIPAWWHRKRKKTMFHTGSMDVRSTRANLSFLLVPTNSGKFVKEQVPIFDDIKAYIFSLEPPEYPFKINKEQAAQGQKIFRNNCAECHGTYGPKGNYPNKIIPIDVIKTDSKVAKFRPEKDAEVYEKSWLFKEVSPDGEPYSTPQEIGYQAPPLDGVWATAPYFHNGSVPTIYHVLNSKTRPNIYTRSYAGEVEDYDKVKLGWKATTIDKVPEGLSGYEQRKICDTSQPGRGNQGHTFGDELSDEERWSVIEFLKTL